MRASVTPIWLRLLVAALLLLSQTALGAAAFARALATDPGAALGLAVICHGGDPSGPSGTPGAPAGQHDADCDLCSICQAPGPLAIMPAPAPAIRASATALTITLILPPARAPPRTRLPASAFPTGPPRLA